MGSPSVVIPDVLETVPDDGVPAVEQWAVQCRAELSRRALEIPMLIRQAEQLEVELTQPSAALSSALETVDADLAASRLAAVTAVAEAEGDAARIVERAATFAANIVRLAGLDPTVVEGLVPQPLRTSPFEFRTRAASELQATASGFTGTMTTDDRFFGNVSADSVAHDPDREFWSEVSSERSPFGRLRRRAAEQRL